MKDNIDLRTGYVAPDGYFQDFALRMSAMASKEVVAKPRQKIRWIIYSAVSSSVAAVIILLIGLFHYYKSDDSVMRMAKLSNEDIIVNYFDATETDVVNYYYFVSDEKSGGTDSSDECLINYISTLGVINVYALLDN